MNSNPIFIVDDDADDQDILREVLAELGLKNEIQFFTDAETLINELRSNPIVPFLIISDINLPKMTGLELRKKYWLMRRSPIKQFLSFSGQPPRQSGRLKKRTMFQPTAFSSRGKIIAK